MKVKINILCGAERHFWVYPYLHWGSIQWSHDPRLELYEEDSSGYGYFTSQEARNVICEQFMADERFGPTDCLMMIDNDTNPVNPKSGTMNNLMDLPMMGLPIVICPVPVIHDKEWMLNGMYEEGDSWRPMSVDELSKPDKDKLVVTDGGPAVKIDAGGFGVVCIQKQVLVRLERQNYFKCQNGEDYREWCSKWRYCSADGGYNKEAPLPPVVRWRDDRGATIKGEDFLFCKRAKELGIQTYIAPHHYCGHYHSYDYGKLPALKYAVTKKPTPADYHITGPCPPITEWAIEPVLADWIVRFLRSKGRTNVLELGSGVSTVMLDQNCGGWVESLEHDQDTAHSIQGHLSKMTCVRLSPLSQAGAYTRGPAQLDFGLMLVDGPPASLYPNGRIHARNFFHLLARGATIILDDADREGERRAMYEWIGSDQVELVERVGRAAILRKL